MRNLTRYVNSICHIFGLHISRHKAISKALPEFVDQTFVSIYEKHKDKTMVPWTGCHATYTAAKYVAAYGIDGDVVECGVWRGGSSIIIAETLNAYGVNDKNIFMYDTYEGMSEPTDLDYPVARKDLRAADLLRTSDKTACIWAISSMEDVKNNILSASYPADNFKLIKGKVESTIPGEIPTKISLLRLDTDWYESTIHALEHLFPRLVVGGVLICDDYGHWAGVRKAVDQYLKQHKVRMLLHTDAQYGAVIGIKQPQA